jgi:hypothetical protein
VPAETPVTFIAPAISKRSRPETSEKRSPRQISRSVATIEPILPKRIEWQPPEGDIPSLNAVRNELEKRDGAFSAIDILDDEITAVRPPRRPIEVDLAKPSADTSAPEFLPTLISTGRIRSRDESEPPIFAALQSVRRYRKLPVYIGLIAAFALAGVSISRVLERDETTGYLGGNDPVAVQAPPIHIENRIDKSNPVPAEQPTAINIAPTIISAVRARSTRPGPAPKPSNTTSEPRTSAISPQTRKVEAIVPSTLVISTKNGRPTATIVEKRDSSPTATVATRPRIVKLPN